MKHVLLVEDNAADAELVGVCLQSEAFPLTLHTVSDGLEALDFIHRRGAYPDAPTPDLVLLDLNLPRMDGRKVLSELKEAPDFRMIPVVVLTSSLSRVDLDEAYRRHANAYIVKSVDFLEFRRDLEAAQRFWLGSVRLPQHAVDAE